MSVSNPQPQSTIDSEVESILAQTIQVRRIGRATDRKPTDKIWFTTQMQDLFVLETDAAAHSITNLIAQEANKARQQLLTELLGEADTYCTHYIMMRDLQSIPTKVEAVPVEVIQSKIGKLNG